MAGHAEEPDTRYLTTVSSVAKIPAMCAWRLGCSCESYHASHAGAQGTCTQNAHSAAGPGIHNAVAI